MVDIHLEGNNDESADDLREAKHETSPDLAFRCHFMGVVGGAVRCFGIGRR
jgi:hypothetical protein